MFSFLRASQVAQMVKNLPAVWERKVDLWVRKIPWRRKQNPLQYSCLENPMDEGAWRAIVMGSQESDTTKWLNHHHIKRGVHLSVSYLSAFSYCSRGSQGKNTEVVCHSLLQWTTFCQNSPPWPICLGWPYMAWLILSLSWWCHPTISTIFWPQVK